MAIRGFTLAGDTLAPPGSRYILAGTSMPIRSSARVIWMRKYATPAARQNFASWRSSLSTG